MQLIAEVKQNDDQCYMQFEHSRSSRRTWKKLLKNKFCHDYIWASRTWNLLWKRGFSRKWKLKIVGKNIFHEKKNWQANFFSMEIKMVDLWLQIEDTKLIFIMNVSMLDIFKFASRIPQIAQIIVSTFKIFWTPPRNFLFCFISNSRPWQGMDNVKVRLCDALISSH